MLRTKGSQFLLYCRMRIGKPDGGNWSIIAWAYDDSPDGPFDSLFSFFHVSQKKSKTLKHEFHEEIYSLVVSLVSQTVYLIIVANCPKYLDMALIFSTHWVCATWFVLTQDDVPL